MRSAKMGNLMAAVVLFFILLVAGAGTVSADVLDNLTVRNPLPQGSSLKAVTYGNGMFVAVGYNAAILTSTDGISWVQRLTDRSYLLENDWFAGVAFGNGTFVAVGHWGQIYTSTDGISWSSRSSGTTNEINAVTYALVGSTPTFVAVGNSGIILTSPDGITWTSRTSGTASYLRGVTYGNSLLVAVGDSGAITTSPDGITWTTRVSGTTRNINAVVYGSGGFTAVASSAALTLTSPDGITWTIPAVTSSTYLFAITYANSLYVAVGSSGAILTSTNNSTWTARISGTTQYLNGVTYGNGTYVAVGEYGVILTSPDGIDWISRTTGTVAGFNAFAYANGTFMAVGAGGTVMTSPDGISWTERYSGSSNALYAVTYAQNQFVAVGAAGTILTSPDGVDWTSRISGTSDNLYGIICGNGTFVAVGGGSISSSGTSGGTILTSSDGVTWSANSSTSSTSLVLSGITFANNKFVAVGGTPIFSSPASAFIISSTDGLTWTEHAPGTTNVLYGVTYGNGLYVVVGDSGIIRTSLDLITWTQRSSGGLLKAITFVNGVFTTVGSKVLTSTDGINWSPVLTGSSSYLYGVATDGKTYVIGGQNGTILSTKLWTTSKTTLAPTVPFQRLNSVAFGNNSYVAVGGKGIILSSTDGSSWTPRESGLTTNPLYYDAISYLYGVAFGNNRFVAVGDSDGRDPGSAILSSSDGVSWLRHTSTITDRINGIAYGSGSFVAVRDNGKILASSDGSVWYDQDIGNSNPLNNIIYANNMFVAVGSFGTIMTSVNGGSWTKRETGTTTCKFTGIAYGNGIFVAVGTISGSEGVVFTSPDGVNWTERPADAFYWNIGFNSVSFGDGVFTAAGYWGRLMTSADGIHWTGRTTGSIDDLIGIAYGNGRFVAVGRDNWDFLTSVTDPNRVLTIFKAGNGGGSVSANFGTITWDGNTATSLPYAPDAQVILTASPAADGSSFVSWNGCDSSSGTQCTVAMGSSRAVTATFLQNAGKYTLNVTKTGAGSGNVTLNTGVLVWNGNSGYAALDSGTPVVLTPVPAAESIFNGWSGEGCSGNGTCTVTMRTARYVTANFVLKKYALNVIIDGAGDGSVHSSPMSDISCIKGSTAGCDARFDSGTEVMLSVSPDITTSTFAGWSSVCSVSPCTLPMNSDKSLTAYFSLSPKTKLNLIDTSGYDTLAGAYVYCPPAQAGVFNTIYAMAAVLPGNWTLSQSKNIRLQGGYLADYGPSRPGYTVIQGVLSINQGALQVDRLIVSQ